MTTQTLSQQFNDLVRSMNLTGLYAECFLKAIKSNALDIEKEDDSSYRLSQIILHAILCELAQRCKPCNPDSLLESENLQRFL